VQNGGGTHLARSVETSLTLFRSAASRPICFAGRREAAASRLLGLREGEQATEKGSSMTESKVSDQLEECFVRCRGLEVPLADRLQAFANEVRRLGPHFQTAVDALVSRLAQSNAGAAAPKVGEPMPAFVLRRSGTARPARGSP
jgi:hypothetical protein